jgi:quinol monooxygenase YgiN
MTTIIVRHTVADYEKWRPLFDEDESRRRANGGKGVNRVYRDADNLNVITIIMDWDNAENALKFTKDPALGAVMQKAGVVGMPELVAIVSPA